MSKKTAQIANFNITFGNKEQPMLDYFDSIIYPAMTSGIIKVLDENEYMFKNVEVLKNNKDIWVLKGILVKKTILEIKSDLNDEGNLVEKDEKHSTAPYSSFVINLLNHRMLYMPNQKGSPSITSFRSTVKYVMETYTKIANEKLEEKDKLPYALVNIIGIPSLKSIDELLKNVKKINSLTLRFYPLNGDIDYTDAFGILTTEMRNEVGCKNGEIVFKSPKSIDGVKTILSKAAGTINPIIRVITNEGSKATLKDDELSEKYEMELNGNVDINSEGAQLIDKMTNISVMNFTTEEHNSIYNRNEEKIVSFANK